MPKDKAPKAEKVKHNVDVSSEDVPGDGMANKAAKSIEKRQRKRKQILKDIK